MESRSNMGVAEGSRVQGNMWRRLIWVLVVAVAIVAAGFKWNDVPSDTVTLVAVGDVLLARGCGEQIERHGVDWLFANVKDTISGADIAFCNLECTLTTGGVAQCRRYLFRADPKLAAALSKNGFDVVSLANNHTLDYGRASMLDTVGSVRSAGITGVGAGESRADALRLRVVERNGLRVGFLAYSDLPTMGVVSLPDRPTIAGLDVDELPGQVRAARGKCDVLVVSMHWGVEYMKAPTKRQQEIAHACIDNGADLILGHHPHVLQAVETYKGKPIIYSMGGFVWDGKVFDADKSAIYVIELRKKSAAMTAAIPVVIKNCRPEIK